MKIVPYGSRCEVNIGNIGFIKNGQRVKVGLIHSIYKYGELTGQMKG